MSEEDIFYLHRQKDGFDVYFFANTSQEERTGVRITLEQAGGTPELWDLNSGATAPLATYQVEKGRLALTLDFPPADARVVAVAAGRKAPHVAATNMTVTAVDGKTVAGCSATREKQVWAKVVDGKRSRTLRARAKRPLRPITLPGTMEFRAEGDNALLLNCWKMRPTGDVPGCADPDFDDASWLDVTGGAWEMQLPQERDVQAYPVTLWYRTSFRADHVPGNLRVLIDGFSGPEHRIYVNGTRVDTPAVRSRLDAEIKEQDINQLVTVGRNVVAVRLVVNRRTDGILDPLKIVGDFALAPMEAGYTIVQPAWQLNAGDWVAQGYPYFSGTGVYTADIELPARYEDGRLTLELDCGDDVASVSVNGGPEQVVHWHPYRVDLTGQLKAGKNTLSIRVTNTLINMLEGVLRPSGLRRAPVLRHEHVYRLTGRN